MSSISYSEDKQMLWHVVCRLLGVPPNELREHPISNALRSNGIITFTTGLLTLSSADIMKIKATEHTYKGRECYAHPVPMITKRKLVAVIAFFHHRSKREGRNIDIRNTTKEEFEEFRTKIYDPNTNIIPWNSTSTNDNEYDDYSPPHASLREINMHSCVNHCQDSSNDQNLKTDKSEEAGVVMPINKEEIDKEIDALIAV